MIFVEIVCFVICAVFVLALVVGIVGAIGEWIKHEGDWLIALFKRAPKAPKAAPREGRIYGPRV